VQPWTIRVRVIIGKIRGLSSPDYPMRRFAPLLLALLPALALEGLLYFRPWRKQP